MLALNAIIILCFHVIESVWFLLSTSFNSCYSFFYVFLAWIVVAEFIGLPPCILSWATEAQFCLLSSRLYMSQGSEMELMNRYVLGWKTDKQVQLKAKSTRKIKFTGLESDMYKGILCDTTVVHTIYGHENKAKSPKFQQLVLLMKLGQRSIYLYRFLIVLGQGNWAKVPTILAALLLV